MSVLRRKKAESVRKKKWGRWLIKGLLWRNYTPSSRWLVWEDEAQGREGNRKEPRNYLRKSQNMNIFWKLNPTFKREWLPTDIAMTFPSLLMTQDILLTWLLDQKIVLYENNFELGLRKLDQSHVLVSQGVALGESVISLLSILPFEWGCTFIRHITLCLINTTGS